MDHFIQSPESALTLLEQALFPNPSDNTSVVDGFELKIISILLEQVYRDDPEVISFPDGRSILAALIKASPDLAVSWWRRRGASAWLPTQEDQVPARIVLDHRLLHYDIDRGMYLKFSWQDGCVDDAEASRFLEDAVKSGVMLREDDVKDWRSGRLSNDVFLTKFQCHETFLKSCIKHSQSNELLSQDRLISLLLSENAVLLDSFDLDESSLAQDKSISPRHPMLASASVLKLANGFDPGDDQLWRPWHEVWWGGYRSNRSIEVIDWVAQAGVDTTYMRTAFLSDNIANIIDAGKRNKHKAQETWSRIYNIVNRTDGWLLEENGNILWHRAVGAHPSLFVPMLENMPPVDLSSRSSKGSGIWDCVFCYLPKGTSKTALAKLNKHFPVALNPPQRAVFQDVLVWHGNGEALTELFERSIAKNSDPSVWVGRKESDHMTFAASILIDLCSPHEDVASSALDVSNLLFSPRLIFGDQQQALKDVVMPLIKEVVFSHEVGISRTPNITQEYIFEDGVIQKHSNAITKLICFVRSELVSAPPDLKSKPFRVLAALIEDMELQLKTAPAKQPTLTRSMRL